MKRKDKDALWVVYLVAFDDREGDPENYIEPFVGMDRIANVEEAAMAAVLRGGVVLTVLQGDEMGAELSRGQLEAEVLRAR